MWSSRVSIGEDAHGSELLSAAPVVYCEGFANLMEHGQRTNGMSPKNLCSRAEMMMMSYPSELEDERRLRCSAGPFTTDHDALQIYPRIYSGRQNEDRRLTGRSGLLDQSQKVLCVAAATKDQPPPGTVSLPLRRLNADSARVFLLRPNQCSGPNTMGNRTTIRELGGSEVNDTSDNFYRRTAKM